VSERAAKLKGERLQQREKKRRVGKCEEKVV
jgi:hypothetical protein